MIDYRNYQRHTLHILITIVFVCFSNISSASEIPSHYPKAFIWTGTVEEINIQEIVISDREFKTANNNISFHRLNSKTSSLQDLKVGMTVGCEFNNSNEIIAFWEFPASLNNSIGPWAPGMESLRPQP